MNKSFEEDLNNNQIDYCIDPFKMAAKETKRKAKENIEAMSILKLIEKVIDLTADAGILMPKKCEPFAKAIQARLSLSTPMEAVILSICVNMFDDSAIRIGDLAKHFGVNNVKLLAELNTLNALVHRNVICSVLSRGDERVYLLPQNVIDSLADDKLPEPKDTKNMDIDSFIDEVMTIIDTLSDDNAHEQRCEARLVELLKNNPQLYLVQKLNAYDLSFTHQVLLFAMISTQVLDNDAFVTISDIKEYFSETQTRKELNKLRNGSHILMKNGLIEHDCDDGQINPDHWILTDFCKYDVLQEMHLPDLRKQSRSNLMRHEDISQKELYYSHDITKEVKRLTSLLMPERMQKVLNRLEEKSMRKGFTCMFYGAPGTGKTETVKQLARITKRDIMLVDVPSIRSKWVGDTEKNIKAVFERYNAMARNNPNAPILLFNEADAILNKRNEESTRSVDKMENAMQNIILQEMENLEGILIATTNLMGTLDAAFERRFLFKIEFTKPTAAERSHIWQDMLPELSDKDAYRLAERYDFSGGQIENIARKRLITNILDDTDDLNLDSIIADCDAELFHKGSGKRIGFVE